jgi:hypothetical protein
MVGKKSKFIIFFPLFCADDLSDPSICQKEKYVVDLFHGAKSQTVVYFDGSLLAAPLGTRGIYKCKLEFRAATEFMLGVVIYDMNLRRHGGTCVDSIAVSPSLESE